ncbi:hypothetical protein ACOSQ4_027500 [Xanthoceras sorbifolium]
MKNLNQSLLAKSSWRLLQNDSSLWSEIIRCKYLKGRPLADCLSDKSSNSYAWNGIAYDGTNFLFWTDSWVPNIGSLQIYALKELDQNQLNRKVLWYLLKWIYCKVFEESFCISLDSNKVIVRTVKEWMDNCKKEDANIDKRCYQIAWQPPLNNWVKVNVDGSRIGDDGFIATGVVIIDSSKNWLKGFTVKKGYGSVLEAEMWGIFEGLKLAWDTGFRRINFEYDSKSAIDLLSREVTLNHPLFSIINCCKLYLRKDWTCTVGHVFREGNNVADGLANFGQMLDVNILYFEEPPSCVVYFILDN